MAYVKGPLQIPMPFLRRNVGLGDVVKRAAGAVGVQPCPPCEQRRRALNRLIQLRRLRGR